MHRFILFIVTLLLMTLLLPFTAAAWFWKSKEEPDEIGSVPAAAWQLAGNLDMQLARRMGHPEAPVRGVSIIITTPAELRSLDSSSPLARQLAEEMAGWFAEAGYMVQEIRMAKSIMIKPETGELLLTRDTALMARSRASATAVLTGTYTITSRSVRFNMQLIHAGTNSVLAKSSVTIPVSQELHPLLVDLNSRGIVPSVNTRLGH
jgi:hypothetical protein